MLSNSSQYAIRALIFLAIESEKKKWVEIKKIASELQLPMPFLSKLLQQLVKRKLLKSSKGPTGGFAFEKDPNEITLMNIITSIEGDEAMSTCYLGIKYCENGETACPFHRRFSKICKKTNKMFVTQTFGQLAKDVKRSKKNLSETK